MNPRTLITSPGSVVRQPLPRRRQGLALVVALSMVALMMVLVVALLNATTDGYKEAEVQAGRGRAKLVANDAVNVALAQLRNATTGTFTSGAPKPWTSQPGGIRVHNMDGSLNTLFKLYSSNVMTASSLNSVAADVPDDWHLKPDDFVDLNQPRTNSAGQVFFPIVDPRAWTNDPLASVEGFQYLEEKGAIGPAGGVADEQRLPMPVRWLYVLRDGTVGALDANGMFQAPGNKQATRQNPIVSRFAFWVDDETCKVNVNTAAEGSFWDTPRADTNQERALARTVPSRLEYMRQPGHPAGVCLSSVLLPNRRISPMEFPISGHPLMQSMALADARDLWRLGRLTSAEKSEGTSLGGTSEASWPDLWPLAPRESVRQPRYADAGELVFDHVDASRFPGMQGPATNTAAEAPERRRSRFFQQHPEAVDLLQKSRFFLTARNAAPEVTLFGTPRVAMWPVHKDTLLNGGTLGNPEISRDTVYNHKVAMAALVKDKPYFIQRAEPGNGIRDFRVITANRTLFEYLQRLTNRPFPGFERPSQGSSTFLAKYDDDRDAILLGMMDYVRSANCADQQLPSIMQYSVLCPGVEHHGFGQISPLQLAPSLNPNPTSNHAQGLGRMLTISEVALIITCRAEVDADGKVRGEPSPEGRAIFEDKENPAKPGDRELDIGFLVETFLPGQGWTDYRPFVKMALAGGPPGGALEVDNHLKAPLPQFILNDEPLLPQSRTTVAESTELPPTAWNGAGGSLGVRCIPHKVLQFRPVIVRAQEDGSPPALSFRAVEGDANQLKLALYDSPGSTDGQDLLQVVPLALPDILPDAGIPVPSLAIEAAAPNLEARMLLSAETGRPFLGSTDVVQSLSPMHGDFRVTASQRWAESRDGTVRTPLFTPHPLWGKQRLAHNLRDQILPDTGRTEGYIPGLRYAASSRPDLPETVFGDSLVNFWQPGGWMQRPLSSALDELRLDKGRRGAAQPELTGDFDNGVGNAPDGPYNNRPDDGHWAAALSGRLPYFDNVSQVGASVPPVTLAAFSPQRLLPSPVMFGSLPTGTRAQVPWQTLLFRPQATHFGAHSPPDHLLLDLFWNPVLEPEPISANLETEGKINLNHEILPFRHITRATALHAAMKAETLMAIPDTAAETYKSGGQPLDRFRRHLDAKQTLGLWKQEVFDQGDVFLTPSQICEQYLVPEGMAATGQEISRADMEAFWSSHRLTGDNSKERPYTHLYSRLTTRSNTYRVHFIAQSLVKARSAPAGSFDSSRDKVAASFTGNAVISRRLDLKNPQLPDYQAPGAFKPLDQFYTWSIGPIENK